MSNNTQEHKNDHQDPWADAQVDETSKQEGTTETNTESDPWAMSSDNQASTDSDPWGNATDTSTPADTGGVIGLMPHQLTVLCLNISISWILSSRH